MTLVAVGHGEVARALLGAGTEETVKTLTRSRARLVDAFEVERRRIERDLRDGAQQRLVALTMTLGLAELERDDPAAMHALVERAAGQARTALADLRDVVRGIHPRVLTDLGLPAAVAELAHGCGIALTIDLEVPERLPTVVESAAYFVVAEAVTNAMKHAGAGRAWVTGGARDGRLVVEVGRRRPLVGPDLPSIRGYGPLCTTANVAGSCCAALQQMGQPRSVPGLKIRRWSSCRCRHRSTNSRAATGSVRNRS
ncbi:sensor histidine kinase [Actinoplanes subtropicus]|uniref:sensor histidine kinase n=1 Tax=Actinoplanes subtropicus TaxID=543632 RepID=UPI001B801C9E|nr:histidine kinase [Actinoplanes subtropicus]